MAPEDSPGDDQGPRENPPSSDSPGEQRPGVIGRLQAKLGGRNRLLLFLLPPVALIVALVVTLALSSGGNSTTKNRAESGGLLATLTDVPTAEATIDLNRPTAVATIDPNAPLPGDNAGDRLVIQKIGVNAPISKKVVGNDGVMPNPANADEVAYYDFSGWPGMGGVPGSGGNSVFSGHVDYGHGYCKNGTVPPPCEAVFWDLRTLRVGDVIEVHLAGQVYQYRVTSNQSVDPDSADWNAIVSSTAQESITVITCTGDFKNGEYTNRWVVTALRI